MGVFRSSVRGVLPPPRGSVAGQPLPAGQWVVADARFAGRSANSPAPLAWVSSDECKEVAAICERLQSSYATHGLWPLVLETLDESGRPWTSGELAGPQPVGEESATEVLSAMWELNVMEPEENDREALDAMLPFERKWPGLAPATTGNDEVSLAAVRATMAGRLGLVAVSRPADVPAALGWLGAVNCHEDVGAISIVLRDWEQRFGAVLVGVGFDTLTLAVQRPPRTREQATRLAAEHFALCPDIVEQGVGTMQALIDQLVGARQWDFWWD